MFTCSCFKEYCIQNCETLMFPNMLYLLIATLKPVTSILFIECLFFFHIDDQNQMNLYSTATLFG